MNTQTYIATFLLPPFILTGGIYFICCAYISIEKYICIRHPNEKLLLNKNKNQIVFFIAVLAFNIFYYLSVVFYQDLVNHYPAINLNGSNQSREIFCDFISTSSQFMISLMDFVNLII